MAVVIPPWDVRVPSEDEVLSWFDSLSNWGRWGPDDELGTLNLITPEARLRGAAAVRHGQSVGCSWDIRDVQQPGEFFDPMERKMLYHGETLGVDGVMGMGPPGSKFAGAVERISMVFHGWTITHLDSLAHCFWDAKLYNGLPASVVTAERGATRYAVTNMRSGVATRGVLLDVAGARGVDWFECGQGVFPEDVEAAEKRQGVRVQAGDAVLLRTGFGRMKRDAPVEPTVAGAPGPHAALVPWLHDRGVAVFLSDSGNDVIQCGYSDVFLDHPFHALAQVALGMWLVDNCDLEPLTGACEGFSQWDFLLTLSPLALEGATGCPINPVAML